MKTGEDVAEDATPGTETGGAAVEEDVKMARHKKQTEAENRWALSLSHEHIVFLVYLLYLILFAGRGSVLGAPPWRRQQSDSVLSQSDSNDPSLGLYHIYRRCCQPWCRDVYAKGMGV